MPAIVPIGDINTFPKGRTSDGTIRSWRCPLHNHPPNLFELFAIAEVDELVERFRKHFGMGYDGVVEYLRGRQTGMHLEKTRN